MLTLQPHHAARVLANIWTGFGVETGAREEPGRHHFDVIDGLAEPDSALTATLLGRSCAPGQVRTGPARPWNPM